MASDTDHVDYTLHLTWESETPGSLSGKCTDHVDYTLHLTRESGTCGSLSTVKVLRVHKIRLTLMVRKLLNSNSEAFRETTSLLHLSSVPRTHRVSRNTHIQRNMYQHIRCKRLEDKVLGV